MKLFKLVLILVVLVHLNVAQAKAKQEILLPKKFVSLKHQKCSFLYVWATWCTICIKEMPQLLKILEEDRQISPIIVDLSSPFVQENFSKKWMVQLAPPFTTYLKPPGSDKAYMEKLEKNWTGTLPYSALYSGGKLKKVWVGELPMANLKTEIARLCR
jgi:thiol-disulfide isomerase/thioredoxin